MSHQSARLRPTALVIAALLATSTMPVAWAQAQATPATQGAPNKTYTIDAGPLEDVLLRFSAAAGIALSFDPALVAGQRSQGLQGRYGSEEGLRRVLQGSGLDAQPRADGSYVLRRTVTATEAQNELPTVRVVGATEGTGSYTTELSNTATKLNLSLRETPQSISVMTHKRMEDQGLTDVTQVLDQTTGLYFNNTNVVGGDGNPVYSRGFELQNFQVNGIPRSHRYGFESDVSDTALFDRVEVVRGASGLLNGVGEPSGAVNLVRKQPTRAFQGHVAAKLGSWDFYRTEADLSGPLNQSASVRGRLVAVHQDNGSFVDRVKSKKDVLYGIVEADLTSSTILSAGIEYQRMRSTGAGSSHSAAIFYPDGSPTGFGPSTNLTANWAANQRENMTVFAGLEHYFDNDWKLRLDLERSSRKYNFTVGDASLRNASPQDAGSFRGFKNVGEPTQSSLAVHANGPYQLLGRTHELVVGGSYYKYDEVGHYYNEMSQAITDYADLYRLISTGYFPKGDLSPTGAGYKNHDRQSGLYAATRLNPLDGLSFIVGGRLSNWKTRTDQFDAFGVITRGATTKETRHLTPYAGVVVDLTKQLSVYASYTDIFQPASLYDAQGKLLDPAQGTNVEAGMKLALLDNRLNISAAVYRTKKDNVPEYVPGPGGSVNYGPTGAYVYQGIDGTKTTGFELDIAGALTSEWQIAGGFSQNKPVDSEGKQRLTYVPRKMLKAFIGYQPHTVQGLTLGANVRWQSEISSTDPYVYAQGSLTTLDLMARYDFTPEWSATFNINNVSDKRYHTNINIGGWYGEPRNASVTLRYAFR
ncbi:TonB-dependent siderophore receptor [Comamonas terrigena]|uniref:TonB-dependent siderophore receptor n=1 Tax=Comamonas terrigena TaxID=32013 RepID=UPI00244C4698|nr:TonB-dependent siderophore receptor [Comamonas terrigena]MDH1703133.1 TonB-dependent siderophore receptor [Comamonas terrigena]